LEAEQAGNMPDHLPPPVDPAVGDLIQEERQECQPVLALLGKDLLVVTDKLNLHKPVGAEVAPMVLVVLVPLPQGVLGVQEN